MLQDRDLNYIKSDIDELKKTNYIAFLNLLKIKLERLSLVKIENVGDVRWALLLGIEKNKNKNE